MSRGVWLVLRTVVNAPVSLAAVAWAVANRADISWDRAHWLVICSGMRRGFGRRAGMTVGSAYLTGAADVSENVRRHEARHADQWAWFVGTPLFAVAYFLDEWISGGGAANHFERHAGLEDGGYA